VWLMRLLAADKCSHTVDWDMLGIPHIVVEMKVVLRTLGVVRFGT